jgi:hypothetical protein
MNVYCVNKYGGAGAGAVVFASPTFLANIPALLKKKCPVKQQYKDMI